MVTSGWVIHSHLFGCDGYILSEKDRLLGIIMFLSLKIHQGCHQDMKLHKIYPNPRKGELE
jgi:hypothetical protein